jgi:HEAT repeat protein|tara:strand:+ start:19594 stop:19956 length:363 start_codon:yes stop_codon:yes gene_type:complete
MVALLSDSDSGVTEVACWAAGERSDLADLTVALLNDIASDHEDVLCREAAVAALGSLGHEAGRPVILAALTDRPPVRRRAVLALAAFAGPDVEAALERAIGDRDWQVSQAAGDLLGESQR